MTKQELLTASTKYSIQMKSAVVVLLLALTQIASAFTTFHQRVGGRVWSPTDTCLFANIIIAGAPASGKGTQCEVIKSELGVVHLSTGDMLRAAVAAETEVGKMAKDYMDNGKLVPDEVIIGIVSRIFFVSTFMLPLELIFSP